MKQRNRWLSHREPCELFRCYVLPHNRKAALRFVPVFCSAIDFRHVFVVLGACVILHSDSLNQLVTHQNNPPHSGSTNFMEAFLRRIREKKWLILDSGQRARPLIGSEDTTQSSSFLRSYGLPRPIPLVMDTHSYPAIARPSDSDTEEWRSPE